MGSKLQPMNKLARTLLCHARSILNYFHYSESQNSIPE